MPDHRAPVITQMLWYRVGAVDDPPGIGGLAHFFEHMMFRGTTANPGDAFATTVARNGGEDNAFTTHDYTAFYEQIAKDRMRVVMGLEADRIANLDLSDTNVRTEREVVLEERRMRVDNDPQSLLREQMEAALHLTHPYGRPVIGWPEEIRRIGRVEAQDFYTHHYAPNNCILVIAGDVTPDEVRTAAEAEYGKLPARELVPRWEFAQPPRLGETRLSHCTRRREGAAVLPHLSRAELHGSASPARRKRWKRWHRHSAAIPPARCIASWWSKRNSRPMPALPTTAMTAMPANSASMPCRGRRAAGAGGKGRRRRDQRIRERAARIRGFRPRQDAAHRQRHVSPRQSI